METATTRFIKDALAGGWGLEHDKFLLHELNKEIEFCTYYKEGELDYHGDETEVGQFKKSERLSLGLMLLDPNAWRACGKTRGLEENGGFVYPNLLTGTRYAYEWHRFIDALVEGKDINTALEGIES